jgi:hypothetical protein
MTLATFEEIGQILRTHQRFAVLGHVRPDGDALGSQLALALSLQALGKEVRVWNEDGMLEKYSFLPRAELLTKPPLAACMLPGGVTAKTWRPSVPKPKLAMAAVAITSPILFSLGLSTLLRGC